MSIARKILMSSGGKKDSTYVDDVFSTYLYRGSSTSGSGPGQTITNGVDLAEEGGLVWLKSRTANNEHALTDTVTGAGKRLQSESNTSQSTSTESVSGFTNSGFTLPGGWNPMVNAANQEYASWTFRKQKGFFDVVTWTGTGSARTIPHNLGSVPGCIMVKKTSSGNANWAVYHRSLTDATRRLMLNSVSEEANNVNYWNGTDPTSTHFSLGTDPDINGNGSTFVAYLFAGGESTAETARSVIFDGNDYLSLAGSSDFDLGTGDFTFEAWIKPTNWNNTFHPIFVVGDNGQGDTTGFWIGKNGSNFAIVSFDVAVILTTTTFPEVGQWTHVACTRSGTDLRLFYNGVLIKSQTNSTDFGSSTNVYIAQDSPAYGHHFIGSISNLRFVKGTAVYTEPFRPPTEPLTNITNTKLLCCNNSSITGSTVAPATITSGGGPTASSDSPFDDPEGYKFGEGGDQNIIKCGSYIGNGSSSGPDINLGWEPQWFIIKNATSNNTNWLLFDSMRGLTDSDQHWEANIKPNSTDAEWDNEYLSPTSRGFRLTNGGSTWVNENNSKFVYIAIRRPDGYVGKPVEAGTDVFAMDAGNGSNDIPCFDSGFPVDFSLAKNITASNAWYLGARLTGSRHLSPASNSADSNMSWMQWDSSVGVDVSYNSSYQSWMWKRHAGFDVVTYAGNNLTDRRIPHSLGKVPEMIWVKARTETQNWAAYNKFLNGGVNPHTYKIYPNLTNAEAASAFSAEPQTSTTFGVKNTHNSFPGGGTQQHYIAILFASVDGICKCGYYDGSDSEQTITTGFQPRFVIIKGVSDAGGWIVLDTVRGWGAGNDKKLELDTTGAQSNSPLGAPTATGFTLDGNSGDTSRAGRRYIYYAHA